MIKKLTIFVYIFFIAAMQSNFASTYEMKIDSCGKTAGDRFEFSIFINSSEDNFVLTSFQGVFAFNNDILNNDSLFFEYIPGSSELTTLIPERTHIDTVGNKKRLMFASGIGADTLNNERIRVGKFRVSAKSNFNDGDLNLEWLFDEDKLTLVLGPDFIVITDPNAHYNQVTPVEVEETILDNYELMQNYPNPFNPATNIKFSLKEAGFVRLTVYNSIGEEINQFFNTELSSGVHEIRIDGSNWASGIYFYRLDVKNEFSETKKMVLVK